MAELTYPFPEVGEVHNYEYLFEAEHARGLSEGRKARPVLVIAAGNGRVAVLAITTKGEVDGRRVLAIPTDVGKAMGLPRAAESAVLVDEANIFEWVGFDVRPVPGKTTSRFGRATPGFVTSARNRFTEFKRSAIKR